MKPRGRPRKIRFVKSEPKIKQFSPRGKPGRPDEVILTLDQYEALRLVDYKGLRQTKAAKIMGVSRSTLGRIIKEARFRLANGLINGKIIRIIGGKVKIEFR